MRVCRKCEQEKEDEKFEAVISPIKYGGNGKQYRRKICKACKSAKANAIRQEYRKEYNVDNKEKRAQRARALKAEAKAIISQLKLSPCSDCAKTFDPVAMDFDHIDTKHKEISRMLSGAYKIDFILEEIKKCEIVCACCHRIRTKRRKKKPIYRGTRLDRFIDKIKSETPCLVCNNRFSPECMDFDHRNPDEKDFNIELMRRYSVKNMQRLLDEMAKCDILCAVCHRIKTHKS